MTEDVLVTGAPDPWPLHGLVLHTPRLELRPDDDAGLRELVALALAGVHPPEEMPFTEPWTDADPRYLGRGSLQYHWRARATLVPEDWSITFLVRRDGRVVGAQNLAGRDFGVTREVSTGSWVGLAHQRQGIGTEMRAAVLGLAFDHLGALTARSEAFDDNPASLAVSRRLGYRPDGGGVHARRPAGHHDPGAAGRRGLAGPPPGPVPAGGRADRRLPGPARGRVAAAERPTG